MMLDTGTHTLNELFKQLGLPATDAEIDQFVEANQLSKDTRMINAPIWTRAQKQFLDQQWNRDSAWVTAIDELNARMSAAN